LTALHDSPADISKPGLNETGRAGSVSLLTSDTWRKLETLEHIAPVKPDVNSDWSEDFYADKSIEPIETIGNLTLLPHSTNASISNRSWRSKRYLYQVLSSPTEKGMEALLSKAQEYEVTTPTEQLLKSKSSYMAQIEALGKIETKWDLNIVQQRGQRLADLCWDRLWPWLN
jgi:Protein of unknown function (DUF1524)